MTDAVRSALEDMLQAVCGPTGFAAAIRHHSKTAYPWEAPDIAEAKARAALAAPPAGGMAERWKMVPVEPTREMLNAAGFTAQDEANRKRWAAMLAASPQPPVASPTVSGAQFEPVVTVNEDAGVTEVTFEDTFHVAVPVFDGIYHFIDKHVTPEGRIVGMTVWMTGKHAYLAERLGRVATGAQDAEKVDERADFRMTLERVVEAHNIMASVGITSGSYSRHMAPEVENLIRLLAALKREG